jgi:hypothetical protein
MEGYGQFIPMPLNYQDQDNCYWPDWISIIGTSNVWLGTISYGTSGQLPYSFSVRTPDGGETWQCDSIPVPGQPNNLIKMSPPFIIPNLF